MQENQGVLEGGAVSSVNQENEGRKTLPKAVAARAISVHYSCMAGSGLQSEKDKSAMKNISKAWKQPL